jgi:hypothetical protein
MQTVGDRIRQTLGRVFGDHHDGQGRSEEARAKEDIERGMNGEGREGREGIFEKLGGKAQSLGEKAESKAGEAEHKIGEAVSGERASAEGRVKELEQQHRP